jgi:ribosomal protein S18 acetylase RimI-like enzyme
VTVTIECQTRLDAEAEIRFAEIYEASFPPSERGDTAGLIVSIATGERVCFLARRDGLVVGLAVVLALTDPSVAFLEYLAVAPEERNAGIGGSLLMHLQSHLRARDGDAVGVLLEVDRPGDSEGSERILRERRVGFYLRHGASVVECAPRYHVPNLVSEGATVSFTLLWLPLAVDAPTELVGSFLHRCVAAILTESYELRRDDPLIVEVLAELAC